MVIQADNESDIESVAKVADIARDIGISPVAVSVENDWEYYGSDKNWDIWCIRNFSNTFPCDSNVQIDWLWR